MAQLLKLSGEVIEVQPKNGKIFELEELQKYVAGYIEILQLDKNRTLVINEEGKLLGMPINHVATSLAGQTIVGPVLLIKSNEIE